LPKSSDPAYANLDALIAHPLRSARGYVTWICDKLGFPPPQIPEPPAPERVELEAETYLDALFRGWEDSLAPLTDEILDANEVYPARWGTPMAIEAMLEHAVVHPMRHRAQLVRLLWEQRAAEEEPDM
ncbi:MAG: DinB family protein, partial [Candidatus Eisenbacteria bacterium]|nr:DinB family protein [Candidatus Eisenbacteria bacterium]